MQEYKNTDGTYTSPKNGKVYKSEKALKAHLSYKGHVKPADFAKRLYNVECKYCKTDVICNNIKKHEKSCFLNPVNLIKCAVCEKPIKDYKNSKGTCSRSCANKHFRSGINNGNWSGERYQSLCFTQHKKECVVCKEDKIVAVHHYNEDHDDDRIENLVPLCPTHHQYVHSRYKDEVMDIIDKYVEEFIRRFA